MEKQDTPSQNPIEEASTFLSSILGVMIYFMIFISFVLNIILIYPLLPNVSLAMFCILKIFFILVLCYFALELIKDFYKDSLVKQKLKMEQRRKEIIEEIKSEVLKGLNGKRKQK